MKVVSKIAKPAILIICGLVMVYAFATMRGTRAKTVYTEHLDDVAVNVDGVDIKYLDLAFYILYEERIIEEQARIYNPKSTKDYWNLHSNDSFIQLEAKDAIMGMAVHDEIFYRLAIEEGLDTLSPEEEIAVQNAQIDFWEDLLDVQWKKLPCDEETINTQIRKIAVAEKYQKYLANKDGPSEAAYKYDGFYYGKILEEHNVEIEKQLWRNFVVGDITLTHNKINYINGHDGEEEEGTKD